MTKPFKFRYVDEIAGGFLLILLLLVTGLVVATGRLQGWFEKKERFEVWLPDEGVPGIRAGSEVRILGARAGLVRAVELRGEGEGEVRSFQDMDPDDIGLVAILEVRGKRVLFIGEESEAVLKKDLGGFGATFLEITRGSSELEDNVLPLRQEVDVTNELAHTVRELRDEVLPTLEQMQKTFSEVEVLAKTLSSPDEGLQHTLGSLNELVMSFQGLAQGLQAGEGALGTLLKDEASAEDVQQTIAALRDTASNLAGVSKELQEGGGAAGALLSDDQVRNQLTKLIDDAGEAIEDFPEVVRTTQSTVDEIYEATQMLQTGLAEYTEVAEAAQRHWLLRRFVDDGESEEPPRDPLPVAGRKPPTTSAAVEEKRSASGKDEAEEEEMTQMKGLFQKLKESRESEPSRERKIGGLRKSQSGRR
ncbi:MAG: hypothetical protein AAF191_07535 [Verrucomicrobiota bacterium]